jgi:hypothetical protein
MKVKYPGSKLVLVAAALATTPFIGLLLMLPHSDQEAASQPPMAVELANPAVPQPVIVRVVVTRNQEAR